MEQLDIIGQIIELTRQQTALELKFFFREFMHRLLPGVNFELWQLQKIRHTEKQGYQEYFFDSFQKDTMRYALKNHRYFALCHKRRKPLRLPRQRKEQQTGDHFLFPVIERGRLTHFLELTLYQQELTSAQKKRLKKLVDIFANQLHILNSKDRDPLTGLLNRQAYNSVIFKIFDSNKPLITKPYTCLAIMDLDHFKLVNDTYGHLIGDEVLLQFAQMLYLNFRPNDLMFRYGGEEFIALIQKVDENQCHQILERFRQQVENNTFATVGHKTISIGYIYFQQKENPMRLLDKADRALYYAKEHGRNQIASYHHLLQQGHIEKIDSTPPSVDFW